MTPMARRAQANFGKLNKEKRIKMLSREKVKAMLMEKIKAFSNIDPDDILKNCDCCDEKGCDAARALSYLQREINKRLAAHKQEKEQGSQIPSP